MKKTMVIGMILVILVTGSLFAVDADREPGRNIVQNGKLSTITGTLKEESGEWFLLEGSKTYALHLGNHTYLEKAGVDLEEGNTVTVNGFFSGDSIAAVSLNTQGKTWELRSKEGTPLWAGRGNERLGFDGKGLRQDTDARGNSGKRSAGSGSGPRRSNSRKPGSRDYNPTSRRGRTEDDTERNYRGYRG